MKPKSKMVLFIIIAIVTGALGAAMFLSTDVYQFAGLMFLAPAFWALTTASKEYKKMK